MPPQRRVLLFPTWYPSLEDPVAGVFIRDQAQAIAAHNEVAILYLEPRGPLGDGRVEVTHEREDGLLTVRVRASHGKLRKLWLMLALVGGLRRLRALGYRPGLLHAHVYRNGAVGVVLGRLLGLPVVVSEHNSLFPRRVATRLDLILSRIAFRGAELVAPVSDSLRAAIEAYGLRGRFRVVPNPVDTHLFHPAEAAPDRDGAPRLLTVGRLVPVKNLPRLLHALAELAERGRPFRLDVVGDGPERAGGERLAAQLGLSDRIVFHGGRPRSDVARFMRESDLYVMASDWETLSCVLLEAQASGLPAVAPDVGGVPEVLEEAAGVLVAPNDPAALARGIEQALDERERFDPGEIARATRERFGSEAVAERWEEVYSEAEALGRRRRRVRMRAARAR